VISMNLHQAAAVTGGTLIGKPAQFHGVSSDSRSDCSGRLFIAIKGENFNGENYCQQALDNGAVAVLVSSAQEVSCPQLICDNALLSLSTLAKNWAKQCKTNIVAITGSNGKTTVKNMVKSIFSISNKCSATQGNLNNEIGVPLTLCNISQEDKYAIIEMGAAKLGDISWLTSLVNIHTAVITNVSPAHIGRFGCYENIVKEKSEIIANLPSKSFAIVPKNSRHFEAWNNDTQGKIISFGTTDATVNIDSSDEFNLQLNDKRIRGIQLPIAGKHNRLNAACAAAVALSFNIKLQDITLGLENFNPENGRLQNLGQVNDITIINDSYNANPESAKAAIDVLSELDQPTTLVLGDMAELGVDSIKWHQEIGKYAKINKITHLLTIGKDSVNTSLAFSDDPLHFNDIPSLTSHLLKNWNSYGTLLVKGSRSMQLEKLVEGLINAEKVA